MISLLFLLSFHLHAINFYLYNKFKIFWWNSGFESKKALSTKPMIVPFFYERRYWGIETKKLRYLPEKVGLWNQSNKISLFLTIMVVSKKLIVLWSISIVNCNLEWIELNITNSNVLLIVFSNLSFFSMNKLSEIIKARKDPLPKLSNVVYKISCKTCDASYVGQTCGQLKTRISEHKNHILK